MCVCVSVGGVGTARVRTPQYHLRHRRMDSTPTESQIRLRLPHVLRSRSARSCNDGGGLGIARLHGSMSARERDEAVQKFRSQPACDIFLISTKAGGLGLNLTAASMVVIMEPGWNPTDEEQALRRAYRA
jgi:hypothetical protein